PTESPKLPEVAQKPVEPTESPKLPEVAQKPVEPTESPKLPEVVQQPPESVQKPPVQTVPKNDLWEDYKLVEASAQSKPIKVLTPNQIKGNKGPATFKTYLAGKIKNNLEIALIDGNKNGKYDELGSDLIVFGDSDYAVPMSNMISIKNKLYEFKMDQVQHKVSIKAYDGKTGTVDLLSKYNNEASLSLAILTSDNNDYFDVSNNKSFVLPCGSYSLWLGYIESPNVHMAVRGGRMERIEVAEKKNTVVKSGGELRVDFQYAMNDKQTQIGISYCSLRVFGGSNEEYFNFGPALLFQVQVTDSRKEVVNKGVFSAG
ncbi:MAG: hypothetical protein V1701_09500, partial [Planctomycetota bacterium]